MPQRSVRTCETGRRQESRLIAAGARADFEDGVLVVGGILGQKQDLDVLLQRFDALPDLGQIGLGQCPHFGICAFVGEHRLQIGLFVLGGAQRPDLCHHLLDVGIFRRHLDIGVRRRPGRHLRFEHVETLDDLIHTVAGQVDHGECYSGIERSSAKACSSARIGNFWDGAMRLSSKNACSSASGSSVSIALTGPIEAGDIEIER